MHKPYAPNRVVSTSSRAWLHALAALTLVGCAHSRTPPTAALTPALPSLTQVANRCDAVQQSHSIPIGCRTSASARELSMVLGFRSSSEAREYAGEVWDYLAGPFCAAAKHVGRTGAVYISIASAAASRWDCDLGRGGPWISARQKPEDPVSLCRRVQADRGIPVACEAQLIGGAPAMLIGFQHADRDLTLIDTTLDSVAAPFCTLASDRRQLAVVVVAFKAERRARGFNCHTRTWGPWTSTIDSANLLENPQGTYPRSIYR